MAAVENATDDGTLDEFSSEDMTMPNQKTAIVTASATSRAGHACERDRKNCRTNPISPFHLCHAKQRWPMEPSERSPSVRLVRPNATTHQRPSGTCSTEHKHTWRLSRQSISLFANRCDCARGYKFQYLPCHVVADEDHFHPTRISYFIERSVDHTEDNSNP
jgi:hypothetical protein